MASLKKTPTVSVVMPVYNGDLFIPESIRSVINQSFHDWELIVVDDASLDSSVSLVQRLCTEDNRIRLITLKHNSGAAVARNTAIESARGRYIAFIDCDDLWLPQKLESQLMFMQKTGASFSYTAYERIDESGKYLMPIGVPKRLCYQDLLKTNYIGCSTAMYDTRSVRVCMPTITMREDFAAWLDVLKITRFAYGLNYVLSQYRVYSKQSSRNKVAMAKENWKLYRNIEGLSLASSVFYFCHYAVRGFFRSKSPNLAVQLGMLHRVSKL